MLPASIQHIFRHALHVKAQLDAGAPLDFATERAALLRFVQLAESEGEAYTGEASARMSGRNAPASQAVYLGSRYGLVAWLDEMFILDSPWSARWNERKLEVDVYGSNDRAWRFWQQADIVVKRGDADGQLVYFWCVMLGFLGERRDTPQKVRAWVTDVQPRLTHMPRKPARIVQAGMQADTPPLRGSYVLERAVTVGILAALGLLPILSVLIVRRLF